MVYQITLVATLSYDRPDWENGKGRRKKVDVKLNCSIRAIAKNKRQATTKAFVEFELKCRLKRLIEWNFSLIEVNRIESVIPYPEPSNGIFINHEIRTREIKHPFCWPPETEEYTITDRKEMNI